MTRIFDDVDFSHEIRRDTYDYEVFMSFRNDKAAIAFREWWRIEGAYRFNKWLLKSAQWKDEAVT